MNKTQNGDTSSVYVFRFEFFGGTAAENNWIFSMYPLLYNWDTYISLVWALNDPKPTFCPLQNFLVAKKISVFEGEVVDVFAENHWTEGPTCFVVQKGGFSTGSSRI